MNLNEGKFIHVDINKEMKRCYIAVSYTHLDVYKRQVLNTPYKANNIGNGNNVGRHPPNILTLFSFINLEVSNCNFCGSVSYTHLFTHSFC